MIPYITNPFEEELFYHTIARHQYVTGLSTINVNQLFFNSHHAPSSIFFLGKFEHIGEINGSFDGKFLIENHTPYRYFGAFMSQEDQEKILASLITGSSYGGQLNFPPYGGSMGLRYCPECIEYDMDVPEYEPFIHVEHCLPGLVTCPHHECLLYEVENSKKTNVGDYVYLDLSKQKHKEPIQITQLKAFSHLSNLAYQILHYQEEDLSRERMIPKYLSLLNKKGYITAQGRLKHIQFARDMAKYFGTDKRVYQMMGVDISLLYSNFSYVISDQPRSRLAPLQCLMVMHYLSGNLEEFLSADDLSMDRKPIKTYSITPQKLDEYRKKVGQAIKKHPDGSWHDIRKTCNAAYSYLYQRDREWLEAHMPSKKKSVRKQKEYNEIADRERDLIVKIILARIEILNASEIKRVTRKSIFEYAKLPYKLNLSLYPIARKELESSIESTEEVNMRRFKKAATYHLDNGLRLSVGSIRRTAILTNPHTFNRIRKEAEVFLQELIEES